MGAPESGRGLQAREPGVSRSSPGLRPGGGPRVFLALRSVLTPAGQAREAHRARREQPTALGVARCKMAAEASRAVSPDWMSLGPFIRPQSPPGLAIHPIHPVLALHPPSLTGGAGGDQRQTFGMLGKKRFVKSSKFCANQFFGQGSAAHTSKPGSHRLVPAWLSCLQARRPPLWTPVPSPKDLLIVNVDSSPQLQWRCRSQVVPRDCRAYCP